MVSASLTWGEGKGKYEHISVDGVFHGFWSEINFLKYLFRHVAPSKLINIFTL